MRLPPFTRFAVVVLVLAPWACGGGALPMGTDAAADRPPGQQDASGDMAADGLDARDAADGDGDAPDPRDGAADVSADGASDLAGDAIGDLGTASDGSPATDAATDTDATDGACGSPTDPHNCGTCGHDCTALTRVRADKVECRDGACFIPADGCLPGFGHCSGYPDCGCESDITQPSRCGCGVNCPTATRSCAAPASAPPMCVATCAGTGLSTCGQQCVDLQTNSNHCSACGARCNLPNAEAACVAGQCAVSRCYAGYGDCDPAEPGCDTIFGTFYDCRSCGHTCAATHANGVCTATACTRVCHDGYGNCDTSNPDCETPLDTAASCGTCGAACPDNRPFCGGARGQEACVAACATPTPDVCGTTCTDLQSDPRHCGACGAVCDSYQACERGRCTPRYVKTDVLTSPEGVIINASAMAPDGAYVLGGYFTHPVDFDPGAAQDLHAPVTSLDSFVVKFSADGSYAWVRTWPTGGGLSGLTVGADGSIVAAGSFGGTVDFDPGAGASRLSAKGSTDPFVLKLTASGGFAWARSFTLTAEDAAAGEGGRVAIGPDGSVYTVGNFRGQIDLDPGATTDLHRTATISSIDAYVVKLTSSGAFGWARAFGGPMDDAPVAVAVDGSGQLWLGGYFGGTIDLDPGPGTDVRTAVGSSDAFLVRWDSDGNYRDGRVYGWGESDDVDSISFDSDGSAYIGGVTDSGGTVDVTTTGFIQKLSANGDQLWLLRRPAMLSATAVPGGGVLFSSVGPAEPGAQPMLVTKLDRDGKTVWSIPAPRDAAFFGVTFAADATKLIVGGMTQGGAFDLDPGAGTAFVTTPGAAITRFAF